MSDGKVVFDITGSTSGIDAALNAATSSISRQTAKWTVLGQTAMNALTSTVKAGFTFVKDLAMNSFEYNAQMETYAVNFKTLLGSAEAAQNKLTELKQYAVKTPFAFTDLAQATQTLLAFGVSSEDSALALQHLGDISLGDANKLQSLTLAFGQVSSAGKLAGQDLLQMINAGFNPLQVIAEETGAAYADLKAVMSGEKTSEDFQLRMEAARKEVEELGVNASRSAVLLAQIGEDGMISADMVAAAMRIATSEGGAFYKALENASATAKGQLSTIQDSWDTLTGKITQGAFDKLSTDVFPQVITWLDQLNTAYDENGFAGLKGAAGGIFDELGTLAANAGAGVLAQLYSGITGDTATAGDILAFFSGLWDDASDTADVLVEKAAGLLGSIYEGFTGQEATKDNITATISSLFTGGKADMDALIDYAGGLMSGIATAITGDETSATDVGHALGAMFAAGTTAMDTLKANAGTLLGTIYETLTGQEATAQNVGKTIGGVFNSGVDAANAVMTTATTFFTELDQALGDPDATIGGKIAGVFTAGSDAMLHLLNDAGSFMSQLYEAVTGDTEGAANMQKWVDSIFATPEEVEERSRAAGAQDGFATPTELLNRAQTMYASPAEYGITEAQADEWITVLAQGMQHQSYKATAEAVMAAYSQKLAKDQEQKTEEFAQAFEQLDAHFEEDPVELPVGWAEGAEGELQSDLDAMDLSTTVTAKVVPRLSTEGMDGSTFFPPLFGGQDHAAGGLFRAATTMLGKDGLHTFGESGTEAILPLDTLWRKMGLVFDQAFSANLAGLPFSVLPPLPAAAPAPFMDEERLAQTVSDAVLQAVSGLTVEMDKRTVGRILKPVISQELAHDVSSRRWTS